MHRALEGVKILELTTMITGPLAGCMLADFGADVIKVENPKGGDYFRSFRGGLYSPHFRSFNRNKRSIAIDARTENGKEIILRLVEDADVVIENFRPGVLEKLGLGMEDMRARNPRVIYGKITGFGVDGPYRDRPAYDAVAQSLGGLMSMFLDPENPQPMGPTISDNLTGIYLCYGILAALYERERTGIARRVDVNMLEATIGFMPDPFANFLELGIKATPTSRAAASQSYTSTCADGNIVTIHLSSQDKFWIGCMKALDRMDLSENPKFKTRFDRIDNYHELGREFDETLAKQPRDYWMARLEENDVPFAPALRPEEVLEDEHVKHLDMFFHSEHRTEGKVFGVRRPVRIDGQHDDQPLAPAPTLGEHTDEILQELGCTADEITKLRKSAIVGESSS